MIANMPEAERRKLEALAILEARREVYVNRGRRALLTALCYTGTASADDVRRAVPLPDGIDPKLFGAVPGELVRAGIIAPDGYVRTTRPEAHARPVQRWALRDRIAALAWLKAHPDRPEPVPTGDCGAEHGQAFLFPERKTPAGGNQWA